jgi:flagellar FliL protein
MATAPKKNLKAVPADASAEAPASSGSKKLVFIIIAVALLLILAIGGAAVWYVMKMKNDAGGPKIVNTVPVLLTMENFTVNLQVEEIPQFLQVGMTLQVKDEEIAEIIRQNMPQARNRLLLLLSSKKPSELLSPEGKKQLAAEIIEAMEKPFSPQGTKPEIKDVFFTSFVIQ